MSFSREKLEYLTANTDFHQKFRQALKHATNDTRGLRILDFGSGPTPFSLFVRLQKDQAPVIAYDPSTKPSESTSIYGEILSQQVSTPPNDEFDLTIAHFSLHHLPASPVEAVGQIAHYAPSLAIAEYDYVGSNLKTFDQTFVAEQERRELQGDLFGGSIERCFDFHKRFGQSAWQGALEENGYTVTESGVGSGVAAHKFFLVGKRTSQ